MENLGILKWSRWSIVRKAQVTAAAIGALVIVGIQLLLETSAQGESGFYLYVAREIMSIPLIVFSSLLGMDKWRSYSDHSDHMPLAILGLLAANNAAVFSLFGTLIGWCLEARKSSGSIWRS